jgi:hypothetical protein
MIKKLFFALVVIFALVTIGCANTPNLTVINPIGEPMPEPHYVMKDVGGQIQVTFYFEAISWKEDLDKTRQPIPVFLDRSMKYDFSTSKYDRVMLVMKVFNPRNIKYNIFTRQAVDFKDGGTMNHLSQVAASDLTFRNHEFFLPFSEGTKTVKVSFEVQGSDGRALVRPGNFNYSIN